jgi:N-methylhydantoinase B/oxoprolinase/acetone carboxylase alpha subunit
MGARARHRGRRARGGNELDVAYLFEEPGAIAILDDRWLTYPWGVNGGEPGARSTKWIERAVGDVRRDADHDDARRRGRHSRPSPTPRPCARCRIGRRARRGT